MVPFTSPGPAGGGPPGPPGPPGPGPWAESEPAARRRPSAAERVDRMSELSGRLWMQTKVGGPRGAVPPTWALRPGFREVSDRAETEMVCCGRCKPFVWTILRSRSRRDAERLNDRAFG